MNTQRTTALRRAGLAAAVLASITTGARADVTESKTMTMVVGFGTIHTASTELVAADKKRTDSSTHCDGFLLSMVCGHLRGGEIVRLDKNVRWRLDPKHERYTETAFPTPAQIAEFQKQRAEWLKKLESCPRSTAQGAPSTGSTNQCDMSPPQFDVQNTGETATIARHVARHSIVTMKQTCTKKDTGDQCEYVVRIDAWMTDDRIPGYDEERAFDERVARRMGLDKATMTSFAPQLRQFTAPYAQALQQIGSKAKDLQGIPLKTTISISFGGTRCGAAKQQASSGGGVTQNAGGAAESAAANSTAATAGTAAQEAVGRSTGGSLLGSIAGSAAGAFGHSLLGGFFAKKSAASSKPEAAPTAPTAGAVPIATLFSVTTETTEIRSGPIPSGEFEVPAGWTRQVPKAQKGPPKFACPTVGT